MKNINLIYLAGHISKNGWRHKIVPNLRRVSFSNDLKYIPTIFPNIKYLGPYFISCDHGCFHNSWNFKCEYDFMETELPDWFVCIRENMEGKEFAFKPSKYCMGMEYTSHLPENCECLKINNNGSHGVGINNSISCPIDYNIHKKEVHNISLKAIKKCDIFFAWIDRNDCFGTFTEIGYAKAFNKPIIIGYKQFDFDKWFIYEYGDFLKKGDNPKEILKEGLFSLGFLKERTSYFIKNGTFVKIGHSKEPKERLKQLQTASPVDLTLIHTTDIEELKLHKKFEQYRNEGEWFYYSEEIKDFIQKDKKRFHN